MDRLGASWRVRPFAWGALAVILVALATSLSGLGNDFAYDDVPIIVENASVHTLQWPGAYFTESYWGPVRGNSLYRPLTVFIYAVQWAIGDGSPFPFHALNIVLYALTGVAVLMLARELLSEGWALLATVAWTTHPVHVEAVANVVGQAEMLTAIPMLIATTLYLRARTRGALTARTTAAILVLFACALLTKEHGIVLPGILVAAELAFRGTRFARGPDDRANVGPLARGALLMVLAYLTTRYVVLGAVGGDAPHPALISVSGWERQWVVLGLIPELVRLLLWPVRLYVDYSPTHTPLLTHPQLAHLPGATLLALCIGALVFAWRRDRAAAFAILWVPITFAPVSNVLFPAGILIAERTLFLPSVGVMIALALLGGALAPHVRMLPSRWSRVAIPSAVALTLVAATLHSALRQRDWADNATVFATLVADAPANYRAHHAIGELFGGKGVWNRAETHLRTADSLFPGYGVLELSLARVLHFDRRCAEAIPIYTTVLNRRPDAEIAAIGRTACLLETRQFSAGRDGAIDGLASGFSPGPFHRLREAADSALMANDTIDGRNRWWLAGKPTSKSDSVLIIPVLIQRPSGAVRGRRKMPESLPVPVRPPGVSPGGAS